VPSLLVHLASYCFTSRKEQGFADVNMPLMCRDFMEMKDRTMIFRDRDNFFKVCNV